jgi:NAD(P)-dependent dehydrogenase (short-subunit alcohol dehydrogenase family)
MEKKPCAAFVTGASYGIGKATAIALAEDGFDVAITDLSLAALQGTQAAIAALGKKALPIVMDLQSQDSIDLAIALADKELEGLQVLINNAGMPSPNKKAIEITRDEWQRVMDVNLTGTYFMSTSFGRMLINKDRHGSIISLGSTHGTVGFSGASTYGIAKAGIAHMTKMLAIEWAPYQIRVNCVAPGSTMTETRIAGLTDPARSQMMLDRIPLGRFGLPEDVAGAIRYLASPAASYLTGHTLMLDGGLTAY